MTDNNIYFPPPEIPSKWDIIPIHNSDRGTFKKCRRRWEWSSPAKQNLVLRADIHGVNPNLWFGTGIHWALEQYYNPLVKRDPVEAFKTWFDIQWRGGTVTAEWLPRVYDLRPQPVESITPTGLMMYSNAAEKFGEGIETLYKVRGLEDIIPSPDHDKFDELYELGVNMMMFYKGYAEKHDDFQVLMVEHDFSVPIWDYKKNTILRAIDTREDSPNYGKELEVHARGRVDNVWGRSFNNSIGYKLGIIDYKTAASITEDYFEKLETDEQCTSYLWALETEAKYYDLPHKGEPIEEVLYVALRKAFPKPPTILKSGLFSINRNDESTTYEILTDWIAKNLPGVPLTEKQQNYVDYLKEVGDEQFIIRRPVRRNRSQIANAGVRIYLEALDMLNDPIVYPNISNDFGCLKCVFRAPCVAREDGGDWEQLIADNYVSNKDR